MGTDRRPGFYTAGWANASKAKMAGLRPIGAERRAGELLAVMEMRHGARDGKTASHRATPLLLSDLGSAWSEAKRGVHATL